MEYPGFNSDWCCYFGEIPWITQEGVTQCNAIRRRKLVVVVPFSLDQSVFSDLQKFFQVSFQTLKLTLHMWLTLIIMYVQIIVVCYTLIVF